MHGRHPVLATKLGVAKPDALDLPSVSVLPA